MGHNGHVLLAAALLLFPQTVEGQRGRRNTDDRIRTEAYEGRQDGRYGDYDGRYDPRRQDGRYGDYDGPYDPRRDARDYRPGRGYGAASARAWSRDVRACQRRTGRSRGWCERRIGRDRVERLWTRHRWDDFHLYAPRPFGRPQALGPRQIRSVLGHRAARRIERLGHDRGYRGRLTGRWLPTYGRGAVLEVRMGGRPLAELHDYDGDGYVEDVLVRQHRPFR